MPRDEHRVLNGLSHHLWVWPGADTPSVVLLHGFLDVAASFHPFAEALSARISGTIVAPDLRGHGATARVGAGGYYHFADYVADVHALVSELPAPRFVLGHSMGGVVAAMLAGAFPELVDRLVLVEGLGPPAGIEEEPVERMGQWIREVRERRSKPPRVMSLAEAEARLQEQNARMTPEFARFLAPHATRAEGGGVTWAFDPLHRTRSPHPYSAGQFREFLKRVACPTLLVEGGETGYGTYAGDDRVRDLRDGREVVIEGAGHMVHQDRPGALAEVVGAFFGGTAP